MSSIEYKNPTPEQLTAMREYADLCTNALAMINRYQANNMAAQSAIIRLQESMQWFHSFVLNGAVLNPPATEVEGELIAKPEAEAPATIN